MLHLIQQVAVLETGSPGAPSRPHPGTTPFSNQQEKIIKIFRCTVLLNGRIFSRITQKGPNKKVERQDKIFGWILADFVQKGSNFLKIALILLFFPVLCPMF